MIYAVRENDVLPYAFRFYPLDGITVAGGHKYRQSI